MHILFYQNDGVLCNIIISNIPRDFYLNSKNDYDCGMSDQCTQAISHKYLPLNNKCLFREMRDYYLGNINIFKCFLKKYKLGVFT